MMLHLGSVPYRATLCDHSTIPGGVQAARWGLRLGEDLRDRVGVSGEVRVEQRGEPVGGEGPDAELFGLVGLGAGTVADDDEVRTFGDRTRGLPAQGLDGFVALVAGQARYRTGDDDGHRRAVGFLERQEIRRG